jgi:hypothetical protein
MAEQMEMSWFTVLRWDARILWDYESKLLLDIVLSFLFDIIIYFINLQPKYVTSYIQFTCERRASMHAVWLHDKTLQVLMLMLIKQRM